MNNKVMGSLHISDDVIADIAGNAAMECYGVVGMVAPDAVSNIATILPASRLRRGIVIENTSEGLRVSLYIVVEYGTNISIVSNNLINAVKFALKTFTCVDLACVDVHVKNLKVR